MKALLCVVVGMACVLGVDVRGADAPKPEEAVKELGNLFDVQLNYYLLMATYVLTEKGVPADVKQQVCRMLYAKEFQYWMWVYGPEPKIAAMPLYEKNIRAFRKMLLEEYRDNEDPWCLKKYYKDGRLDIVTNFVGVPCDCYEKWTDYQRYTKQFREQLLGWK